MDPQALQIVQQLRGEIRALTDDVRELQQIACIGECQIPVRFRLTGSEHKVLACILSRRYASRDAIYIALYGEEDDRDIKVVDAFVFNVRKALKPHGIEVKRLPGRGWWLSPEEKAAVKGLVDRERAQLQAA